jgi:DNA/RNA-binding domain of Phe-tRNA-synthetase-like protein
MIFSYADTIPGEFPEIATIVRQVDGIRGIGNVATVANHYQALAIERLKGGSESDLPQIQAWRRAFARMGLKPTQYRSAAESLLRRLRKEGALPAIHPLVDLCNAISMAFAIPIAVFDRDKVSGSLQVRPATGTERYETFAGE